MHRSTKGWRHNVLYCLLLWASYLVSCVVQGQPGTLPTPEIITDRQGLPQAFIPAIVQDKQGFMWIATRDGLCRYDGRNFRIFQPDPKGRPSLSFTGVTNLIVDHQGRIWITTELGDVDLFDPASETFTNFSHQPAYRQTFGRSFPVDICLDRRGRLWLAFMDKGFGVFDTRTGQAHRYEQPGQPRLPANDSTIGIREDRQGRIWAATRRGVSVFDESSRQFVAFRQHPRSTGALPDEALSGLYLTPNGHLLIGYRRLLTRLNLQTGETQSYPLPAKSVPWRLLQFTTDKRNNVFFQRDGLLYRLPENTGPQLLSDFSNRVDKDQSRGLCVDRSDVLWVGTNGAGIRKYNLRAAPFQTALYQRPFQVDLFQRWLGVQTGLTPSFTAPLTSSYHFRYTIDRQGELWFNAASTPFQRLNLTNGRLSTIPFPERHRAGYEVTSYPLATDSEGRVWVAHDSLAWWYEPTTARWISFDHPIRIPYPHALIQLVVDRMALWVATTGAGLYRIDRRTGATRQFTHDPKNPASLSSNNLFCLSADPLDPNRLWVGTFGGGLCAFDKRSGRSRRLTEADGLPNNVIYSAIPDQQGYLWMGTNKGLVRMHRKTFQMQTFTHEDGLLADEFNRFHFLHLPNDRIFMGGLEGIMAFYPRQIQGDTFKPTTEITRVQVNNQPLKLTGDQTSDSAAAPFLSVQALHKLILPYDQNFLTVSFAVMQYNKPAKNRYRYQLEGLDTRWIETNRPEAVYTDLSPGDYVLKLNSSNTSGVWSPYIRTLDVTIQPPWWLTWWAYVLYGLTLLGLGYWVFRAYANRLRMQQAMALQQQTLALQEREARQLREVDELKTRFFSNITHEFRTPLTLILTPTQQLQQKYKQADDQRSLTTIEKNAYQLLGLIDQLMDLAKAEASGMTVQESEGNLSEFVGGLVRVFQSQAEAKQIDLRYQSHLTDEYWFDQGKLERIVYNILANALKFTQPGGTVTVGLEKRMEERVRLTVSDTGQGISADKLPHIFDRFYQVSDTVGSPNPDDMAAQPPPKGTGIGLALVKELVGLQQGHIDVKSEPGLGTTFVVDLPYRKAEGNGRTAGITVMEGENEHDHQLETSPAIPTIPADHPVVLLVEDNDELAAFIAQSLPITYQIHRAANGAEGFERALELMPDLVLSDVLMPVMDGYALCGKLKTELQTSHIPVILLTAKGEQESRTIGLTQGADDYITKPFHLPELQLRIRNQLYGRRRLREWVYRSSTQLEDVASSPDVTLSDEFLSTLYGILDEHLDDSGFGVDELATQIGMSRASLYRKSKAVTDLPVNELIRNYRLKRATHYLRRGQSVAETAYLVGFESPSYFTKCFRDLYQLTPSEFAEESQ